MTSWSALGSGPAEMSNSWNSPGLIRVPGCAVQVIVPMACLYVVLPTVTGEGRSILVTDVVQPGTGLGRAPVTGGLVGKFRASLTVPWVSSSFGTRKVILAYP